MLSHFHSRRLSYRHRASTATAAPHVYAPTLDYPATYDAGTTSLSHNAYTIAPNHPTAPTISRATARTTIHATAHAATAAAAAIAAHVRICRKKAYIGPILRELQINQ